MDHILSINNFLADLDSMGNTYLLVSFSFAVVLGIGHLAHLSFSIADCTHYKIYQSRFAC